MAFLDPFAVVGADLTARQLRQWYYETVKGGTGVSTSDHLKVQAIPGSPGLIGIGPGVGSISVPDRREAYQISNPAMDGDALLQVPPAGSAGAVYHVIVEVTDPEYQGQVAATSPRLVSTLAGLSRPYLDLARFTLPAGAGFDVTVPVEDRRQVTNPQTHVAAWSLKPQSVSLSPTGSGWRDWLRFTADTRIPEWAGRVLLDLKGGGVVVRNGLWHGSVRLLYKVGGGTLATESVTIRPDARTEDTRFPLLLGDLPTVPANRTGRAELWLQTSLAEGSGRLEVNAETTLQLSAMYIQAAR